MKNNSSFEKKYPNITYFLENYGWLELGTSNPYEDGFLRAYNEGSTVWEGKDNYESIDQALDDMEKALFAWFREIGEQAVMTNQEAEEHRYRIDYRIIVDAYDEYEQAMGWITYLQEHLNTPFKARYIKNTKLSNVEPLKEIIVTELSNSEYDSDEELKYFEARVIIQNGETMFEVPLSEIEVVESDKETEQAVDDWHFWKYSY